MFSSKKMAVQIVELKTLLDEQQEQINHLAAQVAQMRGEVKRLRQPAQNGNGAQNGTEVAPVREMLPVIQKLASRKKGMTVGDLMRTANVSYYTARTAALEGAEIGLLVEIEKRRPKTGERGPSRRCWRYAASL